ncbi:MAG: CrcB family protein [Kiritimatiellia bacterium]|jgi:CrcB protein|nr:CrcB family protein [Kiritimatiellia bacterium]
MNLLISFFVVGCGGFAGSALRYAFSLLGSHFSVTFPHGTLWANFCGCLLLGILSALTAASGMLSPSSRLLLATGFCGGFTTMSTFTHETFRFFEGGQYLYASGYLFLTLFGCIASFGAGLYAGSAITKG